MNSDQIPWALLLVVLVVSTMAALLYFELLVYALAALTALFVAWGIYQQLRVARAVEPGRPEDVDLGALSPLGAEPPDTDDPEDLHAWSLFTGLFVLAALVKGRLGWGGVVALVVAELALVGAIGYLVWTHAPG
jgi:hypothetical protein